MTFNLDDYEPVAARLDRWWAAHETGRVLTKLVHADEQTVCVRVEIFRDSDDERPYATGYAEETREGHVNRTSALENCETSAVGRALANAGYAGSDPSKRPSREEMSKVRNHGQESARPASRYTSGGASDKQKKYVQSLIDERDVSEVEDLPDVATLTKGEASAWIDRLNALPEMPKAARGKTVDEAVAALGGEEVPAPSDGDEPF